MSGFKYDSEGSAALINAQLLMLPGATFAVGAGPPARVEITVPVGNGGRMAHMYFCFGCSESRHLTRDSNLTAGCLFAAHPYEAEHLVQAVRANHACRYFDVGLMKVLCDSNSTANCSPNGVPTRRCLPRLVRWS